MNNLLDPAILFFVLGATAGLVRSSLEIPPAISRFLSLYLLMALGLKGGFALARSGVSSEVAAGLVAAVVLALVVPCLGYLFLRRFVSGFDAAAVAATYGSVSAVTFVTASQYLDGLHIHQGGHMAAAMALMESPAILLAVALAARLRQQASSEVVQVGGGALAYPSPVQPRAQIGWGKVVHESFTDGAQLLLLGAMLVGWVTGESGKTVMQPFSGDLFKGMLAFFLLDMGLMTARNLGKIKGAPLALLGYALVAPWLHGGLALVIAWQLGLSAGDGALLMVLAASASYIAVPAVLRTAMPEANPSLYFGLSLGVTFPMNMIVGIPVHVWLAQRVLA